MTELEKRAKEYAKTWFNDGKTISESLVEFAQQETEILSKHILELQADKGRLTDENKRLQLNEQLAINNSKLFLEQLTKAKGLLKNWMKEFDCKLSFNERAELVENTEAFLKE